MGAGALTCLAAAPSRAQSSDSVVVELFTSQSCSSCPPADFLLAELHKMPGVMALTYHVDYWDYLGWKDTFGNPEFSQRQYNYAKQRGDMEVFTPQVIINGEAQMIGSDRTKIMASLEAERRLTWPVALSLEEGPKEIVIEIGEGEGDATLWLMPILSHASVKIDRGEMAGRVIDYHNIVRDVFPAAMWSGKKQHVVLPKDGLMPPDGTACVALLQRGKVGPILGCASWGNIIT